MNLKSNGHTALAGKPSSAASAWTGGGILARILCICLFAGLDYVGSGMRIPLQPVPITMQTLFVLLAGAVLGGGTGAASQLLYLTAGIIGLPVFAGGTFGLAALYGPTGGYLIGFLAAPLVVGYLIKRKTGLKWNFLVFSLGAFTILLIGSSYLYIFYIHNLRAAFYAGFLPFIPGDLFKIAAAASIYSSYAALRSDRRRHFSST